MACIRLFGMSSLNIACRFLRDMPTTWMLLFVLTVLFHPSSAVCNVGELECCLTQFDSLVSPTGIKLSETNLAAACTIKIDTLECMEMYLDQCLKNGSDDDDLRRLVNKTSNYISDICPPTSDFVKSLVSNQECILNSSTKFQTCYNRTVLPDEKDDVQKHDCCSYKEVRNCAVQVVENECGASVSQLVQEQIENTNGAFLEWSCKDIFEKCENSAVTLASSAFFVLWKIALIKFLF